MIWLNLILCCTCFGRLGEIDRRDCVRSRLEHLTLCFNDLYNLTKFHIKCNFQPSETAYIPIIIQLLIIVATSMHNVI